MADGYRLAVWSARGEPVLKTYASAKGLSQAMVLANGLVLALRATETVRRPTQGESRHGTRFATRGAASALEREFEASELPDELESEFLAVRPKAGAA